MQDELDLLGGRFTAVDFEFVTENHTPIPFMVGISSYREGKFNQ
jgi:hypothetical protein